MIRLFHIEAESEDEAFQRVKEGINQDDPIMPFNVEYEEHGYDVESEYYITEEEVNI
jgi:hypothetical protein